MKELAYFLSVKRKNVSLNLYDAEYYSNASVIQPLIANLVRYSNKGRYEPFAAESWKVINEKEWRFTIRSGLSCENGEVITPSGFKKSIELSIRKNSKSSPVPVLSKLEGVGQFLSGRSSEVSGISVDGNQLVFRFTNSIRNGLVQVLSFAAFGYICSENRDQDTGEWIDDTRFISSGPYRVENNERGYTLFLRDGWSVDSNNIPSKIKISFLAPNEKPPEVNVPFIYASFTVPSFELDRMTRVPLVPSYLDYVALSPRGFFSNLDNRRVLYKAISDLRDKKDDQSESTRVAKTFYFNQKTEQVDLDTTQVKFVPPEEPMLLLGAEPTIGQRAYPAWMMTKEALDSLGIKYKFDTEKSSLSEIYDSANFDISIGGYTVGGGAEVWWVNSIFCSEFGPRLPDPSGRVCKALADVENGNINDETFVETVNNAIVLDRAIIPISHYGLNMFVSAEISLDKLSPLTGVLCFDQLELE